VNVNTREKGEDYLRGNSSRRINGYKMSRCRFKLKADDFCLRNDVQQLQEK